MSIEFLLILVVIGLGIGIGKLHEINEHAKAIRDLLELQDARRRAED